MPTIRNISAVFFDMDGTLVDSEIYTEPLIENLCREYGITDVDIDCSAFFGVSWAGIERGLVARYPQLAAQSNIAERLHEVYHRMLQSDPPLPIDKSRESVIAAHGLMPTAIVSSSGRASIEKTMRRLEIDDYVSYYAGAEDYARSKPAPDGYLQAAEVLRVDAGECLVFEDSIAGIQSARKTTFSAGSDSGFRVNDPGQ